MKAPRHYDWPERLGQYLQDCSERPFVWGQHDCCLFAADVIQTLTGVDPAAELRGTYESALGAARVIKDNGGFEGFIDSLAAKLEVEEIHPGLAQRGDVVMVKSENQLLGEMALAVVGLDGKLVVPGERGLITLPSDTAVKAWRI